LFQTLPETPERTRREIDIYIALGASLLAVKGYAASEVGETYTSAQQLCEHLDDPHQLFHVLWGLWAYTLVRAELQTAYALGEQLLSLAQQQAQDSTTMLLVAHAALGRTLFWRGAVAAAHAHFAQGIALYDLHQHRASAFLYGDAGVVCASHDAWTLLLLGYHDQALARSRDAVTLAQQRAHPLSLGYALHFAAQYHQFRREVRATQERAEVAISLATEQGFPLWMALGSLLHGWALVHDGQGQEGITQLTQGLMDFRATGAELNRPYCLSLLAEAHGTIGEPEAGLTALTEALTLVDITGECVWEPESSENQVEAESCFHHALDIARSQQAKSFELRSATSLARLWQQQSKRQEAHDLLASVYHWFTEGFDTADLKDAKALLEEIGEQQHDI
jgi:predicted ATPase